MLSLNDVKEMIREVAVSRLGSLTGRSDIQIEAAESSGAVFAPWMTLILVTGPQIRISLKIHFKSKVARALAAPLFRSSSDKISIDQGIDFIREFSNLTAGGLKKTLAEKGYATGISLPIVTRGFDEVFFRALQTAGESHYWTIRLGESELLVSGLVELLESIPQMLTKASDRSGSGKGEA